MHSSIEKENILFCTLSRQPVRKVKKKKKFLSFIYFLFGCLNLDTKDNQYKKNNGSSLKVRFSFNFQNKELIMILGFIALGLQVQKCTIWEKIK